MKRYAELYRRRLNWSIIPLIGKKSLIKWKEYQDRLPDLEEIDQWWTKYPDANIGLVTGKISGVVVFDCDSKEALDYVQNKGLPTTVAVQSSKPYKQHFYFKYPEIQDGEIKSLNGRYYYKLDLDVKANGGFVVLPPSIHETTGTRYRWVNLPIRTEIAEMDIWQLEFCMEARKRRSNKFHPKYYPKYSPNPDYIKFILKGVSKGERDESAFSLAKFYGSRGVPEYETEGKLIQWNYKNNPPLDLRQIKKCIRSAYFYVQR